MCRYTHCILTFLQWVQILHNLHENKIKRLVTIMLRDISFLTFESFISIKKGVQKHIRNRDHHTTVSESKTWRHAGHAFPLSREDLRQVEERFAWGLALMTSRRLTLLKDSCRNAYNSDQLAGLVGLCT